MDRRAWLAAFLAVGLAGCNPGKADVSGKVTYQGKPVGTGTVVVRGPDGIEVTGTIQPDGSYTALGVTAGAVKVAVISRDPSHHARVRAERAAAKKKGGKGGPDVDQAGAAAAAAATAKWTPLPDKYESIETSGLTTTLSTGSNQFDIALQ